MAAMSQRVRELDRQAGEAVTEARKYFDKINEASDDGQRREFEAKHDECMARHDKLIEDRDAQIKREENLTAAERRDKELRKGTVDARGQLDELETRDDPDLLAKVEQMRADLDATIKAIDERGDGRRPDGNRSAYTRKEQVMALGRSLVRDGLAHWVGNQGSTPVFGNRTIQVPDLSERDQAVLADMSTRATDAQSPGMGSAGDLALGGYLRPTDVMAMLEMEVATAGPMVDPSCVTVFETMTGNPLRIPRTDQESPGGKYIAGATGGSTSPKVTPRQVQFAVRELGAKILTSESVLVPVDLLQDAVLAFPMIMDMVFNERIYHTASASLTDTQSANAGNGPNSLIVQAGLALTGNDRPQASRLPTNPADVFDTLADACGAIDPRYRSMPRFGFQMHDSVVTALRKARDNDGQYLWRMGNVADDSPPTIWGKQYWVNQSLHPTDGLTNNDKPIVVGDMSKWWTRIVAEFNMRVLPELYAEEYAVGYLGFERNDGGLINTKALKVVEVKT